MGIYIYTCRSEKKVIDGVTIGRFTFAYKFSTYDGWEPNSRYSNRYVKSFEARAEKARDSFADAYSLFIAAPSLSTKNLVKWLQNDKRIPVHSVPRDTFQFIEEFDDKPCGYLSLVNGKVTYTHVAARAA